MTYVISCPTAMTVVVSVLSGIAIAATLQLTRDILRTICKTTCASASRYPRDGYMRPRRIRNVDRFDTWREAMAWFYANDRKTDVPTDGGCSAAFLDWLFATTARGAR